jgi:hypothetical protein
VGGGVDEAKRYLMLSFILKNKFLMFNNRKIIQNILLLCHSDDYEINT